MVSKASVVIVKHKEKKDFYLGIKTKKRKLAEFPGGKTDKNESSLESAIRECYEETGIIVYTPMYLGDYFDGSHMCSLFYSDRYFGELKNSSEGEAGWFSKRAFLTGAFPEWSKKKFELLKILGLK